MLLPLEKGRGGDSEVSMRKERTVSLKILIVLGSLAVTGIVTVLFGRGLAALFLSVLAFAIILWWITRRPKPEGELPCSSVSCCHYLEDNEEKRS